VAELATRFEPEARVREARGLYLRENGFSLAMYEEPSFERVGSDGPRVTRARPGPC
jgi:hypothetical protein